MMVKVTERNHDAVPTQRFGIKDWIKGLFIAWVPVYTLWPRILRAVCKNNGSANDFSVLRLTTTSSCCGCSMEPPYPHQFNRTRPDMQVVTGLEFSMCWSTSSPP